MVVVAGDGDDGHADAADGATGGSDGFVVRRGCIEQVTGNEDEGCPFFAGKFADAGILWVPLWASFFTTNHPASYCITASDTGCGTTKKPRKYGAFC